MFKGKSDSEITLSSLQITHKRMVCKGKSCDSETTLSRLPTHNTTPDKRTVCKGKSCDSEITIIISDNTELVTRGWYVKEKVFKNYFNTMITS